MAEFAGGSQSFKHYPFVEIDSNMELANQIDELNPSGLENAVLNLQNFLGFSNDSFLTQHQPELAMLFADNIPNFSYPDCSNAAPVAQSMALPGDALLESKKHKKMEVSESSSGNSSTPVSETGLQGDDKIKRKNSSGRRKRGRSDDKEVEKPKEVIHVRARRGQATDNHSLAERVRRQKINERLRCLQDIVPGCHKTMGMAVMLDEIINYVQSLQNQVEFLSMKLSAASSASDYSSEKEAMGAYQGTNAYEAQEVERLVREGYGGFTCYHSTWPL